MANLQLRSQLGRTGVGAGGVEVGAGPVGFVAGGGLADLRLFGVRAGIGEDGLGGGQVGGGLRQEAQFPAGVGVRARVAGCGECGGGAGVLVAGGFKGLVGVGDGSG